MRPGRRSRSGPPPGRQLARCASCGEPIEDDDEARLTPGGGLAHVRCGGRPTTLGRFSGDEG